eukprot:1196390-Prorocentrum_minimum.AAC.2
MWTLRATTGRGKAHHDLPVPQPVHVTHALPLVRRERVPHLPGHPQASQLLLDQRSRDWPARAKYTQNILPAVPRLRTRPARALLTRPAPAQSTRACGIYPE